MDFEWILIFPRFPMDQIRKWIPMDQMNVAMDQMD